MTDSDALVVHTDIKTDDFTRIDATWELDSTHKLQFTTTDEDAGSSAADVSSPLLFADYLDTWRARVGWMFRDDSEFEIFMKLPISTQERLQLLQKLTLKTKGAKRPKT